ncbi:MAG: isochorismatase family protein [Bdellovibrionales bacterium]|nr:isochorismatase family protein [Bdellovibrionales bacterium]
MFFKNSTGSDFLKALLPADTEVVIEKTKSSAFTDTNLLKVLNSMPCTDLVLVGFTANECVKPQHAIRGLGLCRHCCKRCDGYI